MVNSLIEVDKLEWDNEILSDVFNDRDQSLIWQIPLSTGSEVDSWYWWKENNGFFTVKSAYGLQQQLFSRPGFASSSDFWRKLWKLKLPPKVKTKGTVVAPAMLFTSWFEEGLNIWSEVESVEAAMILWSIWNTRNDVVWNDKLSMVDEVIQNAKINYVDWFNAQQADKDSHRDHHEAQSDKWKPPEFPIIKVNVDGAIFSFENQFGVGLVAWSASGVIVQAKTVCKIGALQSHEVEAMGMKEALSLIKANDWHDVIVESDCLQVILDLQNDKIMASP
ncbi:uncharacterized protein LOC115695301 [Cannabis sativa]|uniref:uncharacterized protein LOC115695301 n=1 Tax=Cannabis sativa TaxID=3483 RepID=UPI0011E017F0|nr:uncharacterized protein LOC115695301 [Cannabis sativa]